jgi:hypothetical protein
MTSMRVEPCDWPLIYCGDGPDGSCSTLANMNPVTASFVERAAVSYLWNWTGRQFGTCPVVVRPCREDCGGGGWATYRGRSTTNYLPYSDGGYNTPWQPALINGQWYNFPCGNCADSCSCGYVPTIALAGPVESIEEVKIAGAVLPATDYRLDNFRYLVRIDGGDWPTCQDMTSDVDELGSDSLQVTYNLGLSVPAGGQLAAGMLACELGKAACGNTTCKLPQRLQSITRQQVQMTVLDSYGSMYEYGTTGLWVVDSWVGSILASNRRSGTRIASPDLRPTRRTTAF